MAAEETQSGVKSFYEDYVPYFVSRIKDIQTSRALKRRRNDQEGVERCDKMIKEVKSNWKAFYESAVENTLESIEQQPGDETVEEGSCYFSSDEDVEKGDENEKRQDGVDFEKRGKVNFVDYMHQNGGKQGLNNDEKAELNIVDDAGRNNADEIKNGNAQLLDAEDRNTGTSQEEKSEKDKEKKVSSRTKKECPLPGCDKTVIHLPRHLREAHKWSPRKAKTAVQKFGLRKTKVEKIGNKKRDYHVMKICPIPGCRSNVRRIADHLTGKHKLKRTSERYKDALKTAMKAPVGEHVFTKLKKERLERKALLRDVFGDEREEALDDSETLLRDEVGDESGEAFDESAETEVTETATEETEDNETAAEETEATEAEATETEECGDECSDVDDKTPPTTTEMLNSFKIWLLSPDGGKNDMKTATQHMKQLLKVISIIDPAEFQIATLFDYKLIREKFITEYAEPKYYPKTIKSYIMSVRHFYTYVITDEPKEIKVDDKDALMSIRERLKRWSKSYKKQSNRRLWEKREEDVERRVTPDIINEFERSKAARDAIILLGQLSGAHNVQVAQRDFTLVRDFLLAEVSIDNANRAGVLANMTVEEFQKAHLSKDDQSFVVKVKKHKTLDSKGPANIVLSATLHSWMDVYLNNCRSVVINNAECPHFFLSWMGKSLESSQIAKALKSVFKKANLNFNISSNDFRKGAVTEVHDNHEEYKSSLAVLLDHDESTAKKYYRLSEKEKSAVIASKKLASAMRSKTTTTKFENAPVKCQTSSEETSQQVLEQDKPVDKWNDEFVETLRSVFEEEINQEKITISCVREKIKGVKGLEEMDARTILQKVRSQWRYSKNQHKSTDEDNDEYKPPSETETTTQRVKRTLFEDDDSETVISPTVYSKSSKGVFSNWQFEVLLDLCQDMVTSHPISKPVIKQRLEATAEGQKVLKSITVEQLVNRLKYERKRKANKYNTLPK